MTELWRELGGYVAMVDDAVDMVVAEARIRYLASLGFDDEAELVVRSVALGNTSMTTELAIERGGDPVAEGELRHVFVDPERGGTTPIPEPARGAGLVALTPELSRGAASARRAGLAISSGSLSPNWARNSSTCGSWASHLLGVDREQLAASPRRRSRARRG